MSENVQLFNPSQSGPETLKSLVKAPAVQARIKEVLKEAGAQFTSSLISLGNSMPDVEPHSILQSAMIAASLDFPINKTLGLAWIVPYMHKGVKKAQFQIGYRGIIQLALRSGQYKRMNARAVNEEAVGDFDEAGERVIHWDKIDESKPVAGYVFAFQLVSGFTKICYWSRARVEAHARRYSQAFLKGWDSAWKTHFDEMALKTVIKNELSKWGILSVQMRRAFETDQAVIDVDGNVEYMDNEETADEPLPPRFDPPKLSEQTVKPPEPPRAPRPANRPARSVPERVEPQSEPPPQSEPEIPWDQATPAGEPEQAPAPPEPAKTAPKERESGTNYLKAIRGLMRLAKITEPEMILYLRTGNQIKETLTTLDQVDEISPEVLTVIHNSWNRHATAIAEARKARKNA